MAPEEESMESTRVVRVSGIAGVLATIMILGGQYLSSKGIPGMDADAATWTEWVEGEEGAIETGVYLLLVPGLLLFLCMFGTVASLLPAQAVSTRLAGYGALAFFVCMAAAGVLSSTTASSAGFFGDFQDPTALSVYTGVSAGFHLQIVGIWSLSITMVAVAWGMRHTGALSNRLFVASWVLAAVTVAAGLIGFGIVFALVWILAVAIGLLRGSTHPARHDAVPEPVPN